MALDFVQLVNNDLKAYSLMFVLNPKFMRRFDTKASLVWKKVKFTPGNKSHIPAIRGVYAFVVEHNIAKLPQHGYIMYVGIAGHESNNTLRARYGNYLKEKRIQKRAAVHYMLNNWSSSLCFHYAEVTDKRINLKSLEKRISDTLMPPFSTNDFSLEIRQAKRAF